MPLPLICRTATPFAADLSLDEPAFEAHLERLVTHGHGIYLASGGSGESHAMSPDEIRRVYEIGVALCRGRVPAFANPPEQHTAQAAYEHAVLAAEAGVEMVNLYGPSALHGYVPTDEEYLAYHADFLGRFRHPVALAPNPIIGYAPRAALVAQLCNRYPQIRAINLALQTEAYMAELLDNLKRSVDIYVPLAGALNMLAMGAKGLLGAEANILPQTHRAFAERYQAGDIAGAGISLREIRRFTRFVSAWGLSPRWLKMAMRVLGLPGGTGGPRPPYLMPSASELETFAQGLRGLDIAEIDAMPAHNDRTIPKPGHIQRGRDKHDNDLQPELRGTD